MTIILKTLSKIVRLDCKAFLIFLCFVINKQTKLGFAYFYSVLYEKVSSGIIWPNYFSLSDSLNTKQCFIHFVKARKPAKYEEHLNVRLIQNRCGRCICKYFFLVFTHKIIRLINFSLHSAVKWRCSLRLAFTKRFDSRAWVMPEGRLAKNILSKIVLRHKARGEKFTQKFTFMFL